MWSFRDYRFQSIFLFLFLLLVGGVFHYSLYREDIGVIRDKTQYIFNIEEERVKEYLESYYEVLNHYKSKFEKQKKFSSSEFKELATQFKIHFKDIRAFNFVDANYIISEVFPEDTNSSALNKDLKTHPDPYVREVFEAGLSRKKITFLPPVKIFQGGSAFIFYVPVQFGDSSFGWINVVIMAKNLFEGYKAGNSLLDFDFAVQDKESERFFVRPKDEEIEFDKHITFSSFLYDRELLFYFNLEKELALQEEQSLKDFFFLLVIIFALVILFYLYGRGKEKIYQEYLNTQNESNLLKVLVHDLSSPVQVVLMGLQNFRLQNQEKEQLKEFLEKLVYLEKYQLGASEVIHTVRNLYKGGVFLETPETVNFHNLTKEVFGALYFEMKEQDVKVVFKGNLEQSFSIKMEASAFRNHILKNILSNSVKFSKPNTELTVIIKEGQIIFQNYAELIEKEHLNTLNNLTPLDSTLDNTQKSSLGLGLFIAKIFCLKIGMDLFIEQDPETGIVSTTLTVNR